jgi:hypothetical protein
MSPSVVLNCQRYHQRKNTSAAGYHHFKLARGWRQHSDRNHHASTWEEEWGEGDRLWARDDAKDWNVNASACTWFWDVMALSLSLVCELLFFVVVYLCRLYVVSKCYIKAKMTLFWMAVSQTSRAPRHQRARISCMYHWNVTLHDCIKL